MPEAMYHVLHIEDDPADACLFEAMLEKISNDNEFRITRADCLAEAEKLLKEHGFSVILLDLNLQDSSGAKSVDAMKHLCPDVPIIVLTGTRNEETVAQALRTGAQDFFVKGEENGHALKRAIRYSIERMQLESKLFERATRDSLTGLANRGLLFDRLHQAIARSKRNHRPFALLYLDLDKFKEINDVLGHSYGDILLQQIGDRIVKSVRDNDTVARLGGDEFAVLLEELSRNGLMEAKLVVERIVQHITASPYEVRGQRLNVLVSVGVAIYPLTADTESALLEQADKAMYDAKRAQNYYYKFAVGAPQEEYVSRSNGTTTGAW